MHFARFSIELPETNIWIFFYVFFIFEKLNKYLIIAKCIRGFVVLIRNFFYSLQYEIGILVRNRISLHF